MSDESETVSLLREIRDLQRAHFEQYKEFAAGTLARSANAAEARDQALANAAQARQQARAASERGRVVSLVSLALQLALLALVMWVMLRR